MSFTHISNLVTDVMIAAVCLGSVAIIMIGIVAVVDPTVLPWIHDDDHE